MEGKVVKQVSEFAPNKFLVGIDEEPGYRVVDRIAASEEQQLWDIQVFEPR